MESPAPRRARRSNADKEARKANFVKKIFNGDQATKNSSLVKRKPTLMKKAKELETLCGIDVSIVCFDPNSTVAIWPENELDVKKRCSLYMGLNKNKKKEWNVSDLLRDKKRKIIKKKQKNKGKNIDLVISSLLNWLDGLSGDELRDFVPGLETKLKSFRDRMEFLLIRDQQQQQQKHKQEEESEKYCFSSEQLSSMETRPFDYYFDPVVEFDHNKINENQLICVEDYGINNGIYGNPIHNYNNYYYMNNMVGAGAESSSSNSLMIYSSESDNPRTSDSIYDVMPISQWPQNFDTQF